MTDMEKAIGLREAELDSALSDAKAQADDEFLDVYEIIKSTADSMAADTTSETGGPMCIRAGTVRRIDIDTEANTAGHADNHATITVSKRDAAAGNLTTLGTYTTDSDVTGQGTLTKWVRKSFNLTEANVEVVAGGRFTWSVAKGGSGVVLQAFRARIYVVPNDKATL